MLQITQEQLDVMGSSKLPEFFQYVANYIKAEFPEFYIEKQDTLLQWVSKVYMKAKKYQINTVKNHIKYVNYCCLFGDDFDTKYPFANAILTSEITANSKMAKLKDAFIYELNKED